MIINSYMTIQAIRSVAFFIKVKKERNPNARFSPFNYFIIISIYLFLMLRLWNHVGINLFQIYALLFRPDQGPI